MVTAATLAFVVPDAALAPAAFALARHAPRAAAPPPPGVVDVRTSDDEWFPVKRRLLRRVGINCFDTPAQWGPPRHALM